jgi:hypothetical protein
MEDDAVNLISIKENIKNYTLDEALQAVDEIYEKWIYDTPKTNMFEYLTLALTNFGISIDNLQLGTFDRARTLVVYKFSYLRLHFNYIDDIDEDVKEEVVIKFNKIFRAIVDAENAIRYSLHLQSSMTETDIGRAEELDIFKFTPIDTSGNNSKQNLMLFLLENLMRKGYRRYKGECYAKTYNQQGYDTHSWRKVLSLNDFIYEVVKKEIYYEMWQNLTSETGIVKWAVNYLENHRGFEFEDIKRNRHVFAFNNGIYITKNWSDEINPKIFHAGVETLSYPGSEYTSGYVDEFIPFEGPGSRKIGEDIIAAKYFPYDFDINIMSRDDDETKSSETNESKTNESKTNDRYDNWYNIIIDKCPYFKSIMDYQEWDAETQRWLCILIGRLTFDLGELDEWQIAPYLLGQAGTGKSTILNKIVKFIYDECDIGTLSNNMEVKFGLGALQDKLAIIGPELKGNFSMEQSEFQSIITGEDVQVAVKNKTASSVKWIVPVIMAGNEVPQYSDNAGSISRRLCVFLFNKKVGAGSGDTQLGQKLKKEIAYILPTCIKAYLDAVNRFGSSDIWAVLPQYFRDSRDEMAETTNALVHFLKSDIIEMGTDKYIKESVFIDTFNAHCKEMNINKVRWTKQYCLGPFSTFGLTTWKGRKKYPRDGGIMASGTFIIGVDFIQGAAVFLDTPTRKRENGESFNDDE